MIDRTGAGRKMWGAKPCKSNSIIVSNQSIAFLLLLPGPAEGWMLLVPFVFSMSRFQGPSWSFRCYRRHSRQYKDYNFWRNENFHNLYERLLHERKLKSGYLERRIYEWPLHLRVSLLSRMKASILQNYLYINLFQNVSLFTAICKTSQEQE